MLKINIMPPCQTGFTVETDCSKLANSLILKHGKYAKADNNADFTITAIKKGEMYEIAFGEKKITTKLALRTVEDIMYENRKYDESIFAVHGGAVEYNNGAYLIVAATTSGKTTLTAYLSSRGLGYITDDCILINRESFEVVPFNTPIHLRGGGYDVLCNLGCIPKETQLLDDVSIKRYVYTPDKCVTRPLPLKKIFFINRTSDTNEIREMSTTEKITALLKSPITNYEMNGNYLAFISRLAKVTCQELYYSDMSFVYEVIKNG